MTAVQCAPAGQAGARVEQPGAAGVIRGVVRIADARAGQHVTLAGTIRVTETATAGSSPLYRCVLADGTGEDDQQPMRRVLELSLTAHGYAVDGAATGASALERARQRVPDLIVLDLGLPDMDGLQVIAGVREFSAVPILVISARDAETAEAAARAAGADDYLTKPFEIGQLVGRVRAALPSAAARPRGQQAAPPN
jgi:CheY-like chemotaxis protein